MHKLQEEAHRQAAEKADALARAEANQRRPLYEAHRRAHTPVPPPPTPSIPSISTHVSFRSRLPLDSHTYMPSDALPITRAPLPGQKRTHQRVERVRQPRTTRHYKRTVRVNIPVLKHCPPGVLRKMQQMADRAGAKYKLAKAEQTRLHAVKADAKTVAATKGRLTKLAKEARVAKARADQCRAVANHQARRQTARKAHHAATRRVYHPKVVVRRAAPPRAKPVQPDHEARRARQERRRQQMAERREERFRQAMEQLRQEREKLRVQAARRREDRLMREINRLQRTLECRNNRCHQQAAPAPPAPRVQPRLAVHTPVHPQTPRPVDVNAEIQQRAMEAASHDTQAQQHRQAERGRLQEQLHVEEERIAHTQGAAAATTYHQTVVQMQLSQFDQRASVAAIQEAQDAMARQAVIAQAKVAQRKAHFQQQVAQLKAEAAALLKIEGLSVNVQFKMAAVKSLEAQEQQHDARDRATAQQVQASKRAALKEAELSAKLATQKLKSAQNGGKPVQGNPSYRPPQVAPRKGALLAPAKPTKAITAVKPLKAASTTKQASILALKPTSKPTSKLQAQPASKQAAKPAVQPAIRPAAKPAAKPVASTTTTSQGRPAALPANAREPVIARRPAGPYRGPDRVVNAAARVRRDPKAAAVVAAKGQPERSTHTCFGPRQQGFIVGKVDGDVAAYQFKHLAAAQAACAARNDCGGVTYAVLRQVFRCPLGLPADGLGREWMMGCVFLTLVFAIICLLYADSESQLYTMRPARGPVSVFPDVTARGNPHYSWVKKPGASCAGGPRT
jgi:hypothetical protein